jgi:hypothetical protein
MLFVVSTLCVSVMSLMYIAKEYTNFYERTFIYFESIIESLEQLMGVPDSKVCSNLCDFESKGTQTQTYDEFEFDFEEEI